MPGLAPQLLSRPNELASWRVMLGDGAATTLHVSRFSRDAVRARLMLLPRSQSLRAWCDAKGIPDAIVGGFFARPAGTPMGDLRIGGMLLPSIPFDSPWDRLRSCLYIDGREIRIAPRYALAPEPKGDVLQAGPLLVRGRASRIHRGTDPEGFSAGAHQFDSDITRGRYPRAALAMAGEELLAVVCDGRSPREAGLTLAELADALIELGAEEAINLDGGGSASLISDGRLRNRPREEHGVPLPAGRPIATAIAFVPA
jgi:Phosphodiester glycosidase